MNIQLWLITVDYILMSMKYQKIQDIEFTNGDGGMDQTKNGISKNSDKLENIN